MNPHDIASYTFTEQSSKMFLLATPPKPVGGYRMGEEANVDILFLAYQINLAGFTAWVCVWCWAGSGWTHD